MDLGLGIQRWLLKVFFFYFYFWNETDRALKKKVLRRSFEISCFSNCIHNNSTSWFYSLSLSSPLPPVFLTFCASAFYPLNKNCHFWKGILSFGSFSFVPPSFPKEDTVRIPMHSLSLSFSLSASWMLQPRFKSNISICLIYRLRMFPVHSPANLSPAKLPKNLIRTQTWRTRDRFTNLLAFRYRID